MSLLVLGYIAVALSLVGIVLNANKKIICWLFFLLGSIAWIVYSGIDGDVPSVILWATFSLFNVYGWIQWRKDRKPKEPLKETVTGRSKLRY